MDFLFLDITFFCGNNSQTACTDNVTSHKNADTLLIVEIGVILFFYLMQLLILCYNTYSFIIG